ncbi:MAG: right-handed parallel beta-helix repeat-containing protein, partial [Nanoarchaeota archaeon]|nr:right-handed parallel beta-helix repeat-containing protein [Nanoarchaeota archaeon]
MKLNKSKFIITVLILSIFIPAIVSASSGPSLSDILKYKNPSSFESFLSAKKNVDSSIGMANPAAIYCRELGYEYKFVDSSKGKSGVCVFPDETECGQWQFLQGECGQEWSYCAINGYNIITKTDGKNSISKDYAVCVDKDDKEIGSVTELIKLSEKATVGKSYSPIQESDEGGAGPLGPRAPSSFDWRDVSGHNWLTSVQDQGGCGSCWAFSAVGVTEAMYNIRSNNPNLDINLSEQYLVTDCHTSLLYDQSCCGGRKELALMYIRDDGIPDEECMKYVDDHGCTCTEDVPDGPKTCDSNCNYRGYKTPCSDKTCSIDRCLDWESRLTTIDETAYVSNNPDIIKQRLIERGPLAASMGYGDDFGGDWNGDIYECTDDTGTNHGVVIVGYDDVGDYWIIRNSYGPDWEDNGYFKVGYGECSIESSVYYADVETGGGCGTITENTILSGDLHSIGTCITFGADDITLDCANNRIIGNGDGYGIYAKDRSNIKVKNCRIEDFTAGIYLDNVHDSDFGVGSTLRIDDSIGYGIDLRRSSGNRVLNAIISDCHTGIGFYISDDNLISSTDILSSEYFDVSSSSDSDNIIKSSDFDKNKIVFADSDSSLELQWKLSVRVIDSNGQGVGQADVTITNKKGTQVCSDQTNPDGYIPSCLVTEYIHKGDGSKDYYTPHTITAEKGGDYDDRVEYVERDESVVLVFGTPQSSCGNIYDDTILQNDLYYSGSGACIYFEGEGITLNCNEFRIIGPDTEHAVAVELSDGSIGNDNVIKNCKIENFKFGISSSNSNYISGQKIISNEISNCKVPITLRRVEDMDISGNTITNYGENGANIIGISDSRIHHNTISNGNHGMWVENGNNNEFYENEFSYNTATDYSIGLYLFNCGYNDVLNNDFIGNKEGFALNGGSATVAGNLAKDNIYGLHSNNNGGEFYNNKLEGNTEAGIWLTGHNNEVYENEYVPQGRTKYLILLGGGHDNLIRNEILSGSTVYDIYSQWGAFYNELLDSTFNKAKFGYEDVNEELAIEWSSDVRVVDGTGYPLGSAFVTITDDKNNIVFQDYTETNGYIPTQKLIEYIDSKYSEDYRTPHTFEVELSGFECETKELYIDSPQEVTLTCDISLSSPGDLCNVGSECGSSYCEGSVSNPARCCTAAPTSDGWYGGGDDPGCGVDPDSEDTDYYCDATGAEQPEIISTFNCDSQDDCTTHCDGDNVVGDLDYYVILNTNTCDSTGGGIVEDCTT